MTRDYSDEWLTVYQGDARTVLSSLDPESVHCVVTSPPYWGLRDYGTATWEGGDTSCNHELARRPIGNSPSDKSTLTTNNGRGPKPGDKFSAGAQTGYGPVCPCGAHRIDAQLGLEATPEEYVAALVDVFRSVRRVLRADGTVWLNLGDCYFGTGKGPTHPTGFHEGGNGSAYPVSGVYSHETLKGKDLVGIPWRVAFALQADGWYLRSDIIWAKPNPMPESVTDRPTKSHEYVFLLSKSARYYFDADAVREPGSPNTTARPETSRHGETAKSRDPRGNGTSALTTLGINRPDTGRNLRTVWTIATEPYPGAHFATFPRKLVEPCIKAGTPERGVCPDCGAPWEREVEVERGPVPAERGGKNYGANAQGTSATSALRKVEGDDWYAYAGRSETTGWRPSCAHVSPLRPVPATVLDPFAGTGTTGLVAQSLSRRAVLIDLNADYLVQCLERNRQTPLGLVTA